MRKLILIFLLLNSKLVFSDSIQKWTDASGQVHYGDNSPPASARNSQQIEVHSNFDESSYKAAMKRNTALFKEVKQIEKREKSRAKEAEKRLNDYFSYLDKKSRELERARAKKRRFRESERNRTSIKVKRGKAEKVSTEKNKPLRLN